jgi:LSD1 subclass zinc finger protein
MAAQLDTFSCKGCGATLAYSAGSRALKCDYCDAITEIERSGPAQDDASQLLIPLTVEADVLQQAVLHHLASGDYAPDDLVERAQIATVERFYVPAFTFSGTYVAQWTASFGYDRSESYIDIVRRTDGGESHRVPVSKTRTVTEWKPVSGTETGAISMLGYSGNTLPPEAMQLVEQTDLRNATVFNASFLTGLEVQPATLDARATYTQRAEARVNQMIDANVMQHAQGDKQRDWHWSASIDKKTASILVPVCRVLYEYKGKKYTLWVDGANPQKLAGDALPAGKGKIGQIVLGYALPAAAIGALLVPGVLADDFFSGFSTERLAGTLLVCGYAFWRHRRLVRRSQHARQQRFDLRAARIAGAAPAGTAVLPSGVDWLTALASVAAIAIVGAMLLTMPGAPNPQSTPAPAAAD